MALSKEKVTESLKGGLLMLLGIGVCIAIAILLCNDMSSCASKNSEEYAAKQEAERIRETHTEVSVDPAEMAPARSMPYVIADDDLCRIELTGQPAFADDFVTGYERLRSYEGDVIEFEVTNKSNKVAISVGQGGDWEADGRYSLSEEMISEEGMPVRYYGPIDDIEPGKTLDSHFAVFNEEHGSLEYIDALHGLFEICDGDGNTIALYPFSWEDFEMVFAHELPATFVDDGACSLAITDLAFDGGAGRWEWGYELTNKGDEAVHLGRADGLNVRLDGMSQDMLPMFDGEGESPSAEPGKTVTGRMSLSYEDEGTGEVVEAATNEDEMPRGAWGTLALVAGDADGDGKRIIENLPFYISLPDPKPIR